MIWISGKNLFVNEGSYSYRHPTSVIRIILIRRNFRKPHISIRTKIISRNYTNGFLDMIPESLILDPERYLIDPGKNVDLSDD